MKHSDERFMREALRLARKGLGRTSPNPAVGAVVVRRGKVISRGYHRRAGEKHAEVDALERMKGAIEVDDTLYVNLEPCHHFGRTPPCTEAIMRAGLKNVVVGMRDPNPSVEGGGCDFLAQNGVKVKIGVLETECRRLNEAYLKYVTRRIPFVIAKSALTLDGFTATSTGHSRWITNERSRQFVHRLRDRVDCVMVGVGTIAKDDPLLTTRLKSKRGRDPCRVIVDTELRIPRNARVLKIPCSAETMIAVGDTVAEEYRSSFEAEGVTIIPCPMKEGLIDLKALMKILGERSVTSVMVEGGATLMGSLIREKLIDKFCFFKAPKVLGGDDGIPMARGKGPESMKGCLTLKEMSVRRFGEDLLISGYPEYWQGGKVPL
ncbi:MAG: bifunctional diaminohydroxyphosphoribosylaminopyrimidine deaminase/5-amino-6-(5-phosphoribosylamino)uracil reductase RibD [Deltaproteobacteria bacterium]|nr:bifunctional diaminohydroxyphosphoribosylaminopyrimidine deaminase/5-amino-6-(5-phosphoribosylamino)uracil reductase RibD [Deltaproteobacteria bacterium]